MTETQKILGFQLSRYQAEFVEKFLSVNSPPSHILSAPAGSGKTITAFAVIHEMVKIGAQRILILIPALALVDQYRRNLRGIEQDINVIPVDRKIIREIDFLNQKDIFWAKSIALLPIRRLFSDEIKDSILSIHWDLIIVDGGEHLITNSKNTLFFQKIGERQIAERVLFLTDRAPSALFHETSQSFFNNRMLDRFEVTRWTRKDILPSTRTREVRFRTVSYRRTPEEIEFVRKYTDLSKWLSQTVAQNKIRSRLVSSSLYAAEKSLRKLRNQLVHGELTSLFDVDEGEQELIRDEELLGDISSSQIKKKSSKKDLAMLMNDLFIALELLDKIHFDAKLDVLSTVIKQIDVNKQKTWIYASYQDTISYLHSSLRELTLDAYQLNGQISAQQLDETLHRFNNDGGIVIASTRYMSGIDLPIDNVILYDTPESENLLYILFTRLSDQPRERISDPISLTAFDDTSNVIRSEKNRLQKLQGFLKRTFQEDK